MASKNEQKSSVPVYGGEDGFLAVRSLEDNMLDAYLQTYAAKLSGYKLESSERATFVTMKIEFPTCEKRGNADMWAWFIVKAAHPTASKPKTLSVPAGSGWAVYVTWPIWNSVKFMESKREGNPLF